MWQLNCDVEGETCMQSLDDSTASSATEARENGKREGWTRRNINGKLCDFCPAHSKRLSPQKRKGTVMVDD